MPYEAQTSRQSILGHPQTLDVPTLPHDILFRACVKKPLVLPRFEHCNNCGCAQLWMCECCNNCCTSTVVPSSWDAHSQSWASRRLLVPSSWDAHPQLCQAHGLHIHSCGLPESGKGALRGRF